MTPHSIHRSTVVLLTLFSLAGSVAAQEEAVTAREVPKEVQLSFEGADVNFVVNWLAEMTGKSVVKHKDVNCQLTILSPKKLPVADAIRLVRRSLALEGFSIVDTDSVIMLVPDALAGKIPPSVSDGTDQLEGKQTVVRFFTLKNISPDSIKDKLRAVIAKEAKIEVVNGDKLYISASADNVQLVDQLIKQLDVTIASETVTEMRTLKYAEPEEVAAWLGAIYGGRLPPAKAKQPQQKQPKPPPAPGVKSGPRFLADTTFNRVIVTAHPDKLPEIFRLIDTFDQEKPQDVMVRSVELALITADDLAREIAPLYQKLRGQSLKDTIEIAAHERSNKLIVLSSKRNFEEIRTLVDALDTEEGEDKAVRTVLLKHADAEDIAEYMTDLHQKPTRNYWYDYQYGNSRKNTGDIRFQADRRRNAVVVVGPPNVLDSMEEQIRAQDEPVDTDTLLPRIFKLQFVSAYDIELMLNDLFLKKDMAQVPYWRRREQEVEDRDIGKLYGKVRLASNFATNSLIVTANSEEAFTAIGDVVEELDKPAETGDTLKLIQLKHAKAVTLANNLNVTFAQDGAPPLQPQPQQQQRNNAQRGSAAGRLRARARSGGVALFPVGRKRATGRRGGREVRSDDPPRKRSRQQSPHHTLRSNELASRHQ